MEEQSWTLGGLTEVLGLPPILDPFTMADAHAATRTEKNWYNWKEMSRQHYLDHWRFYLIAAVLYYPCLRLGQRMMRDREAFQLKRVLLLWNLMCSLLSGFGAYILMGHLLNGLKQRPFMDNLCDTSFHNIPSFGFVLKWYTVSKIFEWIDTMFLVLRKKPVIFLHWYHHLTTALYCWWGTVYSNYTDISGAYFAGINMCIHFLMYGYYALTAIGIRPPFSFVLTALQTLQMMVGLYVAYHMPQCQHTWQRAWHVVCFAWSMYGVYLYLFTQLFMKKWQGSKPRKSLTTKPKSA